MTASEAIERIREHARIHLKKEPQAIHITEALQLACIALEKQIPKKVENYYTEDTTYGDEKAKFGSCCYCGSEVQEGMRFCMDCGQALDWSDTE